MTSTATDSVDERVVPEWDLADRMTKALRLVGLSVNELSEIMGVTASTVSRWLHGHNRPNKATLMIWSDLTGVDLEWLETGQRACRDSNPKPSVLEPGLRLVPAIANSVRAVQTVKRAVPGHRTRRLSAVS